MNASVFIGKRLMRRSFPCGISRSTNVFQRHRPFTSPASGGGSGIILRNLAIFGGVGAAAYFSRIEPKKIGLWTQQSGSGPEIIVEVIGADMNVKANTFFDNWSKPDIMVSFHRGSTDEKTQIEANTYNPRFFYRVKIPYDPKAGLNFKVMEADVINPGNKEMGRAFIDTEKITELLDSGKPALLSIGENVGVVMIRLHHLPKETKGKGWYGKVTPLTELFRPPKKDIQQ